MSDPTNVSHPDMKRFDMIPQHSGSMIGDSEMKERTDGDWVKFEDYDALRAEVERLTKALDTIANPRRGLPEEFWTTEQIGNFARETLAI